jgi:hypothetical protein
LTWDQVVRVGYLTEFRFKPQRHQDIEWTMNFTWISQDDQDVPPNAPKLPDILGGQGLIQSAINGVSAAMFQASDALQDAASLPGGEFKEDANALNNLATTAAFADQDLNNLVNSDINAYQNGVTGFGDTSNNLAVGTLTATQSSQRVAALAQLIQNSALDYQSLMESESAQEIYAPTPTAAGLLASVMTWNTLTAGQALKAKLATRAIKDSARDLGYQAANQALSFLQATSQPDIIVAFVAAENQDLRYVSTQFYGTPDDWISLMQFNGLFSSALSAGQVVFVPIRRAGN